MSQVITKGETFVETIDLDDQVWDQFTVGLFQAVFLLCEADFLRIKDGKPRTLSLAYALLLASTGLGLSVIGKVVSTLLGHTVTVHLAEWIGLGVGFFISLILYIIGLVLPNDRKRVLKHIEKHFADSPRTQHIVRKE